MIENPFCLNSVCNLACFYSRKKKVKLVLEMLGRGQSVSVIGPSKIGKTSFLLYISQPEVIRQHGLDSTHYRFVYFSCQGLNDLDRETLYALILDAIREKVTQQGDDFAVSGPPNSYISFERALGDILNRELKLVLLLDEFEALSENPNLGNAFFSGLRALTTRLDVAYVTVSQRPLPALAHTKEHFPFFSIFVPLKLGLFHKAESQELVENYVRKAETTLSQEITSMILDLGGGHPFFLHMASSYALKLQAAKKTPLGDKDSAILAQVVREQAQSHFEYYWKQLNPREQHVLATLPSTPNEKTYREELETLACLCLIVKENRRYEYFSPLFRDFVQRQKTKHLPRAGQLPSQDTPTRTTLSRIPTLEREAIYPLEHPLRLET